MATSLQTFLNTTTTNNFRITNTFELTITPPKALRDIPGYNELIANGNIVCYADGFTIPSRTQNFADVGFKGYSVPVPTNIDMEKDHTVTIRADVNGKLRNFFLIWLDYVTSSGNGNYLDENTTGANFVTGDKTYDSTSIIEVSLIDPQEKTLVNGGTISSGIVETYRMYGVRIASVGGFTVSNTDASVATFDVGFKSVYWDHQINAK
jgi:hypothetical protein